MKVQHKAKYRNHSGPYKQGRRFYTDVDMAIIKLDEAVLNSMVKRGEVVINNNQHIVICGCGVEGCFLHISNESCSEVDLQNRIDYQDRVISKRDEDSKKRANTYKTG